MTTASLRRVLLLGLFSLLSAATPARAQEHDERDARASCGTDEDQFQADRLFRVLSRTDPDMRSALAAAGIAAQTPTAPHGVLRDAALCASLRAELPGHINPIDISLQDLRDARLSFLELGDYLGVIVTSTKPLPKGIARRGAAPVYIFARSPSKLHDDRGRENDHDRGDRHDKNKVKFVTRLAI